MLVIKVEGINKKMINRLRTRDQVAKLTTNIISSLLESIRGLPHKVIDDVRMAVSFCLNNLLTGSNMHATRDESLSLIGLRIRQCLLTTR